MLWNSAWIKAISLSRTPSHPEGAAAWKRQLDEFAPVHLIGWSVQSLVEPTSAKGLELRDRQMLNMAALAAMGGTEPQLTGHIKTAVDVAGMTKRRSCRMLRPPDALYRRTQNLGRNALYESSFRRLTSPDTN